MGLQKTIPLLLLFAVVITAACVENNQQPADTPLPDQPSSNEAVIEITAAGFEPATVTIVKGGTATFVNLDAAQHWPASVVHPTHTVYPGSDIQKCFSGEQPGFDACRGLDEGESYSFVFDEVGTWGFHDHLQPSKKGTVVVTE